MESDQRYYSRRAAEEFSRAARAMSSEAKEWHTQLAQRFTSQAGERATTGR